MELGKSLYYNDVKRESFDDAYDVYNTLSLVSEQVTPLYGLDLMRGFRLGVVFRIVDGVVKEHNKSYGTR